MKLLDNPQDDVLASSSLTEAEKILMQKVDFSFLADPAKTRAVADDHRAIVARQAALAGPLRPCDTGEMTPAEEEALMQKVDFSFLADPAKTRAVADDYRASVHRQALDLGL